MQVYLCVCLHACECLLCFALSVWSRAAFLVSKCLLPFSVGERKKRGKVRNPCPSHASHFELNSHLQWSILKKRRTSIPPPFLFFSSFSLLVSSSVFPLLIFSFHVLLLSFILPHVYTFHLRLFFIFDLTSITPHPNPTFLFLHIIPCPPQFPPQASISPPVVVQWPRPPPP